ncbi:MAG: hypothetical protein A3H44_11890 [Gammaproteobacteria bacterium RIFCSPLOWO2_02_FULL_57_10]|nr:MAG: hypothetical protein A3H44_11890 [Gammaproteobacteria bacterium RIFCSPLOWO2_02_FULL_57_10]
MKLVWIHGAPAAGKLTVAKVLKQNFGFKLLHNHLAVDMCLAIYEKFGDRDFHDFADSLRRDVIVKAKQLGVEKLVMTYMVCGEKDLDAITQYLEFFDQHGIEVFPVHLSPKVDVLLSRVEAADRQRSSKMSNRDKLKDLLTCTRFLPIQHHNLLVIDNSELAPELVAGKIMQHSTRYER